MKYVGTLYRPNWIKMRGQKYKSSCIVIMQIDDEVPKFAKIENIFIVNSKIVLEVNAFNTLSFCSHYHAYGVKLTSQKHTILINNYLVFTQTY